VTTERTTFTKAEREYVKGIVRNLSFQRFSDRKIVQWLHDEKQIDVDRSTVSKIRNKAEQDAAKWYTSLRESGTKYVAVYKQRLDSLLSYQKKLHEVINQCKSPDLLLKAISELHRIEMSLHTLFKEIPGDVQIEETKTKDEGEREGESNANPMTFDEWFTRKYTDYELKIGDETDEENGRYYRNLQNKYNEYVEDFKWHHGFKDGPDPCKKDSWTVESKEWAAESESELESEPKSLTSAELSSVKSPVVYDPPKEGPPKPVTTEEKPIQKDIIDLDIAGRYPMPIDYQYSWIQCKFTDCQKWFKTKELRSKHITKYHIE
jgi:hypothetical protein